ncbi:GNAT family N-acetyltransferase [Desulfosporosinus sp. PR]|uniref:GNAT family N-acetyltransferase n=1 Tax=Candidatus Desulfosporosinus nitrosoreducens TaxID=3401928 RepID=UPI0027FD7129|nr:GNAT family N-acetyltransferase [Desulfosporosinus sp. PR]MDQ7092980.1 GNAT family N-acetyltransferase [Desulfosporosinus sp. PR]
MKDCEKLNYPTIPTEWKKSTWQLILRGKELGGNENKMQEIRLAQEGDVDRQKEIWQLCFGDPVSYIDFYYSNRYKNAETAVLLHKGEIAAMLTMMPVRTVRPDNCSFRTSMIYAIATDPQHQNKGFATQLIDFSDQYLRDCQTELSVLVPANAQLFDYYRRQGYRSGFYIKETQLSSHDVDRLPVSRQCTCSIKSITPQEYNWRRNNQLKGRFYISYPDEDIVYQKKLSLLSGADIYAIDIEDIKGCLAVERISPDKVLIKELLLPEDYIYLAIKQILQFAAASEYIFRTPPYLGEHLRGTLRPFGMFKRHIKSDWIIPPGNLGYLGFAFD